MGHDEGATKHAKSSEVDFLIPHTVMKCVILEIGMNRMADCRFESLAYKILHFAGEHYLTRIYQDAMTLATHMKKASITEKEMLLVHRMCGDYGTYNLWGYQRPQPEVYPIHLEADKNAQRSKWNYEHQEWKSQAWKEKNWEAIQFGRQEGGLKSLWGAKKDDGSKDKT